MQVVYNHGSHGIRASSGSNPSQGTHLEGFNFTELTVKYGKSHLLGSDSLKGYILMPMQ